MRDFRRLFESAPGCNLVLTPDLSIFAVSDEYLAATLTEREAIVGRNVFEVFPDDPSNPAATGVANLRASLERVLLHRQPDIMPIQHYPIRVLGGGFEERYWSPANSPVLGDDGRVAYIIHHVEDVTDVVRLRREKSEQETKLQHVVTRSQRDVHLLDTAPHALVIVAEDGRIEYVNAQAEQLFGYDRSALLGAPIDVLIPERFRRAHAAHVSRYLAAPAARPMGSGLELVARRSDGTEVPVEVTLSAHSGPQGMSVSVSLRDISDRKRLLDAARRTADHLVSAVESTRMHSPCSMRTIV